MLVTCISGKKKFTTFCNLHKMNVRSSTLNRKLLVYTYTLCGLHMSTDVVFIESGYQTDELAMALRIIMIMWKHSRAGACLGRKWGMKQLRKARCPNEGRWP